MFLTCYQEKIPDYLTAFIKSPAMQRLAGVDMNCGMIYTDFPFFKAIKPYSRLTHSIGVAMIIDMFTHDQSQALSGLFHDIATPVFSHVVDFMNHDHLIQESTEGRTADVILQDSVIMRELRRLQIDPMAVIDYHQYPIADNKTPWLSADRLEYTLSNMVNYHFADDNMMMRLYQDVTVGVNEEGCPELMFRTREKARRFALLALRCSEVYTADADRYAMEVLAGILRDVCRDQVLTDDDLYGVEDAVIAKLQADARYQPRWQAFTKLSRMVASSAWQDDQWLCVDAKKRLIDPYVKGEGRVSALCPDVKKAQDAFLMKSFAYYIRGY